MEQELVFVLHRLCEVIQDHGVRVRHRPSPEQLDKLVAAAPAVSAAQDRLAAAVHQLLQLGEESQDAVLEVEAAANAAIAAAIDATWALATRS